MTSALPVTAVRCRQCKDLSFPTVVRCKNPGCGSSDLESIDLAGEGTLVSFTVQRFRPPTDPDPFQPYAVGLIELPIGISVLGRIDTRSPESVRIGQKARLVAHEADAGWRIMLEE